MSEELERAAQFANPVTGEVLTLASPDEDLGGYLEDLREFESLLREHKALVNRELLARLDKRRNWTLHLEGGLKLSAPSDEPDEKWDAAGLYQALCELADEELITMEAVNAAVEMITVFKVRKTGINALRKNPRLAETVNRFCEPSEKKRYVSVSRS